MTQVTLNKKRRAPFTPKPGTYSGLLMENKIYIYVSLRNQIKK